MDIMDFDINAYSSDEEKPRRPKVIRHRPNYFEVYDDYDSFRRFRLSKRCVLSILDQIEHLVAHPTGRNDCSSASQQLLLTLNYYATRSFLRCSGDFADVSKATAKLVVRRVTRAINTLKPIYIKMTVTDVDVATLRQKYCSKYWPGSAHDSHIFRNSMMCRSSERGDFSHSVLVGDSGYGIKPSAVLFNSMNHKFVHEMLLRDIMECGIVASLSSP